MNFFRSIIADARPRQTTYVQQDGLNLMDRATDSREFQEPDSFVFPDEEGSTSVPGQSNRPNRGASPDGNNSPHREDGFTDVSLPPDMTSQNHHPEAEANRLSSADAFDVVEGEVERGEPDESARISASILDDGREKSPDSDRQIDPSPAGAIDSDGGDNPAVRQADYRSAVAPEALGSDKTAPAYQVSRAVESDSGMPGSETARSNSYPENKTASDTVNALDISQADNHPAPAGEAVGSDKTSFSHQESRAVESGSGIPGSNAVGIDSHPAGNVASYGGSDLVNLKADHHSAVAPEAVGNEKPATVHKERRVPESKTGKAARKIGLTTTSKDEIHVSMEGGGRDFVEHNIVTGANVERSGEGADYPHPHSRDEGPNTFPVQAKTTHNIAEPSSQNSSLAEEHIGSTFAIPASVTSGSLLSDWPEETTGDVKRHQRRQVEPTVLKSNGLQQGTNLLNGSSSPGMLKLQRQENGSAGTGEKNPHPAHEIDIVRHQTGNVSADDGRYSQPASLQKKTAISLPPVPDLKPVPAKEQTVKKKPDSDVYQHSGSVRGDDLRQHQPGSRQDGDHAEALRSVPARPFIADSKPPAAAPRNPQPQQQYSKTAPAEPKVQIGHIDVIIEAPMQVEKAPVSSETTMDMASRYYLRRL